MKRKNRIWRVAALLAAVSLLGTACVRRPASASMMELKKTEGTVGVSDEKGKSISVMENMKLYSGYQMETGRESYAWINLDQVKLAKMDEDSEAQIRKTGKKLEIFVNQGKLFFNITQPLEPDETLDIRTSNMAVGIRGTCGWVEVPDENHMLVYILEGTVECSVTDSKSGESAVATVSKLEMAEIMFYPDAEEDVRCEIRTSWFHGEEIPDFVRGELAEYEWYRELCEMFGMEYSDGENTDDDPDNDPDNDPDGNADGNSNWGSLGTGDSGQQDGTGDTNTPDAPGEDVLTDRMRFLAESRYGVEVTERYEEQGTYLVCLAADGKGAGTPYSIVDREGNTVLTGYEDSLWRTGNGYARILYCEPGTMDETGSVYEMVMGEIPGDVYVELYNWDGDFVERQKLECEPADAWIEGPRVYPRSGGQYVDYGNLYGGDYSASEDTVVCERVADGFIVRSKAGEELGHIVIEDAEELTPIVVGDLLSFWKDYSFVRVYWVDTQ